MIELTVKTLDSQNHQFSVEDDITVEQFKAHIADQVNIPAETQRIIYCGRVLQDNSKLSEYDVNGKVVHLVQRPPPGSNPRPNRPASPPQEHTYPRGFRGFDRGNTMYVGSMAFPGNLMESQGIVPPPPTHSLSGSRLNVARRMLRRAEAVIKLLENPNGATEQPQMEEIQEEEVTPVIEARVIVPSSTSEPIDEAAVLNAVQNSLMNATAGNLNLGATSGPSGSGTQSNNASAPRSQNESGSSTPGGGTPRSSSAENLTSEPRPENNGLPENASRGSEMAELLTMLGQLQTRFAPFLETYQNFMQEDPEVSPENQRGIQTTLNRVSEVLHFLGHAYHSLSDIIIRVRNPPPRPLLCRPILIQHSAVVQAGIPIQVEAQINLSADRPPPAATTTGSGQTNTATATTAADGTATTTPSTTTNSNFAPSTVGATDGATFTLQPDFVGLPFMPSSSMRVISAPMEIRTYRANRPVRQNNNNNTVNPDTAPSAPPASNATDSAASSQVPQGAEGGNANGFNMGGGGNNSNVEFFMEVTPEGITIDSLETTLVGSNQAANEFLRGALNGPPPEFLHSLMHIVNSQIINRGGPGAGAAPAATSTTSPDSSQSSSASQPAANGSGQNSQARGNTATNPTTATHTRSTPRPHVHMTQQAMQGGFDPFLPCNSHHISRRRQVVAAAAAAAATQQTAQQQQNGSRPEAPAATTAAAGGTGVRPSDPLSVRTLWGFLNTLRRQHETPAPPQSSTASAPASSNTSSQSSGDNRGNTPQNLPPFASLFSSLGGGNLPDLIRQGPTLDQLLQFYQDESYVQGESIIADLIVLLVRNITLVDLFTINSGNLEPINRNRTLIQNFFREQICAGDATQVGVERGVERIVRELHTFTESLGTLPARDDIDIVRSVERLFRQRIPIIITTALNLNTNNVRELLNQVLDTIKQLLSLALSCSSTGQQGVEQVFVQVMSRTMQVQDIPRDIRNWTIMTSRTQLRHVISNLNMPQNVIEPYIVRRSDPVTPPTEENRPNNIDDNCTLDLTAEVDNIFNCPMEVEETPVPEVVYEPDTAPIRMEDTEPLPNIVLGSQPWHGQVPEDWVPIITRDAQKQRRQNAQGPFSDAYLSGMPSKRRKIINNSKPQGSLPQVITESVRQAVSATGLNSAAPLDTVATAAGSSPEIQAAYRNLLRNSVQANLRDNEDFTPERFPNASRYFNSPPQ